MKRLQILAAAAVLSAATITQADAWGTTAHVIMVEASHVGYGQIYFSVDQNVGSCSAGTFLLWQTGGSDEAQQIANGQAAFATLLTAKVTGQTVRISGNDGGCTANLLYFPQ